MSDPNRKEWRALWWRIKAQGDPEPPYEQLVGLYSQPHRCYHTLAHIEHCLKEFDAVWHFARSPNAVEMALWYHDAIYVAKAKDNEEKSAELAARVLRSALVPDTFVQEVVRLILKTKHDAPPADFDAQLVVDIDLSSLGLPEDVFEKHGEEIRREYWWVPDALFAEVRSQIFKSFFSRPTIYLTNFFQEKYEKQARRNLIRVLTKPREQ
ncbi:MAG: N-methyl-D-aspartate receptor NMDAR2C subunit [Candidatus Sungiibacteriota bacterium]|uniref:N-methyl-D-aspartate receptor NMDAR2C subunit n=1 Tax=Candidatus Sungiibacteriota bacterium TaxID=2750080 RepID=A0A7T5RIY8_9BACT|nr:MAG: N-methyl-D-aspartate receptor NMDAR2C subunit [Candidatus Sungbacteria bacterium]